MSSDKFSIKIYLLPLARPASSERAQYLREVVQPFDKIDNQPLTINR